MMGRLSDRPMMRAASIPHRGQTTPTAVLVRLAMDRSYPLRCIRLDARNAVTVSRLAGRGPREAPDPITATFRTGHLFPVSLLVNPLWGGARNGPNKLRLFSSQSYIPVDSRNAAEPVFGGTSDTRVATFYRIDVFVGFCQAGVIDRQGDSTNSGLKTRIP